ncbi:hypothetical protein PHAVU_007G196000 [Phaseolus vulgaris]|uniref:SANT domain-containing protein n=1 Tax=Phaseolus vulgaris TaxID=3885 RepID=V7BK33_PHAVU|nr:hypothetical protein PHAVU_007G196000g [Phaseolus vulgaris]ESW16931.1 hypothetical protein PHAVU_007G196000g [Phaseolus vulgaris]
MERTSKRKLIPPDVSYIVEAPKSSPRIGHEYQVEVPSMLKESERLKLLVNPAGSELLHSEVEHTGHEGCRYLGHNDGAVNITVPVAEANLNNSWSDADVKSFLLGLFIFGKNFVQIKRFLENKEMGEILSFYYGKFYKSDEYCRWSECKKIKGRKSITGDKLFSGQKHWELLSRLTFHVSEELKDALQQVSKSYSDGRTSLEEYVSSLKSTVGLGVLVEAVGIGKGKEDLTSPAMECGKKTQACSIQASKTWSSLGPCDIIKHLTGGYQPSKVKSNDIFWEAVWPRLLARGWHSEKLKNQGHLSSKSFVVFLLPGVKKFSRRKLVKGDHYFDSVRDVLSKVIAEPNLLKLEVINRRVGGCNEEEAEKGSNEDGQPGNHHHCYLKHQVSTNSTGSDTSYVHGEKPSDLRESKSLPGILVGKVEVDTDDLACNKGNKHTSKTNHMKGNDDDNISPRETEAAMVYSKENNSNADCMQGKHIGDSTGQKEVNVKSDNDDGNKMAENCENQMTCVSDGNQPKRMHKFKRRARSGPSDLALPPIKLLKLSISVKVETDHIFENSSGSIGSEKLEHSQSSCIPDANKKASNELGHQMDVTSISSSAEGSAELKNERRNINRACLDKGISSDKVEKCEPQRTTNFNEPQVLLKSEDAELMATAEEDEQNQKPKDIILRRSTRNRPLTIRALESLTNKFLLTQRRGKRKDTLALKDPLSETFIRRAGDRCLKNVM